MTSHINIALVKLKPRDEVKKGIFDETGKSDKRTFEGTVISSGLNSERETLTYMDGRDVIIKHTAIPYEVEIDGEYYHIIDHRDILIIK